MATLQGHLTFLFVIVFQILCKEKFKVHLFVAVIFIFFLNYTPKAAFQSKVTANYFQRFGDSYP